MDQSDKLKIFGTGWCPKSAVLANHLQAEWINFDFLNVETDEQAKQTVMDLYNGELKFPTVTFGGKHLKNPTIQELNKFLKENNIEE
jgi:mycoredoxin